MSSNNPATDRQALLESAFLELRRMRNRLAEEEQSRREPLAIVGIGCRFPGGASGPEKLWELLLDGVDAVGEVPPDRWDGAAEALADSPEARARRWGGFLDAVHDFDPYFFQISPREAAAMDPQQRLFLEVAWEALEDAGQVPARLAGSAVGVFAGVYNSDYSWAPYAEASRIDSYTGTGTVHSFIPGRSSFFFDFRGPSIAVDTVCSSSLVAVHLACQGLRNRDCDLALAGGVNLILEPESSVMVSKLQALAPDGRCKTFDERANGFVRGEGCGIVVLKRLGDAVAAGDNIWAVIRGSAVNHDGRSVWMTSPNPLAQQEVISKALANAGLSASEIGYVETHGTGTSLGDPIEIEALLEVLSNGHHEARRCVLGALKTNIGHLEAAAGVAGLIKAALAVHHGRIPPNLHLRQPNPRIRWADTPFVLPASAESWPVASERARTAGVSSFGLSGVNAHAVVQEARPIKTEAPPTQARDGAFVLPLSAATPEALDALARSWLPFLENHRETAPQSLCHSASVRRTHHPQRLAIVADSAPQLSERLKAAAEGRSAPGIIRGGVDGERVPKIAFVFPGQGGQWIGMGRELMRAEPAFRRSMEECAAAFTGETDWSLMDELARDDGLLREGRIDVVQPMIFAMQASLAALWQSWGIECEAVAGQSLGEVAAAFVAGALSLHDAARIICRRSRLLRRISGRGSMALVELSLEGATRALAGYEDRLAIAASYSERSTVLSGDSRAIESILEEFRAREVFCRLVKVDVASHSPQVDPLRNELLESLNGLSPRRGARPVYSTVTETVLSGEEFDADYWVRNLREPVLFTGAMRMLVEAGHNTFVEISPHPVVLPAIQERLRELRAPGLVLESTRREEGERSVMLGSLSKLYVAGAAIQWESVCPRGPEPPPRLPSYPWQRMRLEREFPEPTGMLAVAAAHGSHPLLGSHIESSATPGAHYWEVRLETWPAITDHRVEGAAVVPAAAYVEMAFAAALQVFESAPTAFEDLEIPQALVVAGPREIQLVVEQDTPRSATFAFRSREENSEWIEHARGRVLSGTATEGAAATVPSGDLPGAISAAEHYAAMQRMGLEYGPGFQGVQQLWRDGGEVWARVALEQPRAFHTAPALLDSALQALAAALPGDRLYLPVAVGALRLYGAVRDAAWSRAKCTGEPQAAELAGELRVYDGTGRMLFEATGIRMRALSRSQTRNAPTEYRVEWIPRELSAPAAAPASRWAIAGQGDLAAALRDELAADGPSQTCEAFVYVAGDDTVQCCLDVADAVKNFASRDKPPRLYLVTSGLRGAALWGLGATVAHEHPELQTVRIEVDISNPAAAARAVADELTGGSGEDRIRLRDNGRFVARLAHCPSFEAPRVEPAGDRSFRLFADSAGNLDSLTLRQVQRRSPGAGEIEIEVEAAGLNFLDVLTALGALPGGATGDYALGGECAGRVAALGPGVEGFEVGQPVIAVAPGSFGTYLTATVDRVVPIPPALRFEEAASVPIAFATAYFSLIEIARIQPGERVLIHAAAGGVGLAAVQIAQRAGAEIFATAGSSGKRNFLRGLGVQHVFDSRSLAFAGEIRRETSGEGVDVVLNSLAGEFIPRSLELLRDGGRFVELGKVDYLEGRRLSMRPFTAGLSFHFVDLLRIQRRRPETVRALLERVIDLVSRGELKPVHYRVRPIQEATDAFREMARGGHTGKTVFTLSARRDAPIETAPAAKIHGDGTYLITGGLGGAGLELAGWLVFHGARSLALLGRSGASNPRAREAIADLEKQGAAVHVLRTDVSVLEDLRAAVADLEAVAPPLRGVFHCAAVLEDGLLAGLTPESFRRVFAPKAEGAWNLHVLTRELPLDHFVLFSSAASVLGSAGQANYAAANSFVDELARFRRSLGLPAVSIQWGAWAEVGLAAQNTNRGERLAQRGIHSFAPEQGLAALGRVLESDDAEVAVMSFDFDQWARFYTAGSRSPFFSGLSRQSAAAANTTTTRDALNAAEPSQRRRLLEDRLREHIVQVLRIDPQRIERRATFRSLGLDSLLALELRNRLEADLSLRLPATVVWSFPNVFLLAGELARRMNLEIEEEATASAAAGSGSLDGLSREQLAAALAAELTGGEALG